jgi:hypothetical protein
MGKRRLLLLVAAALVLLGGAGVALWPSPTKHHITAGTIGCIKEGMTQEEVEAIVGAPPGNYAGGRSFAVYLAGPSAPRWGQRWESTKVRGLADLHAAEWVGDEAAVEVWFAQDGRACVVVPGVVVRLKDPFVNKLRRWLGL